MAKQDYYKILGVKRDAGESDIKSAYRKLARKHHPDVSKAEDAAQKFQEATEAYEVLSDPEKRKLYDQFGHAGLEGGAPGGRGAPGGARTYQWTGGGAPGGAGGINFEDIFGGGHGFMGMSLDEILDALGGGGGRRTARGRRPGAQAARGQDLEYPITLDFLQAVRGAKTSIRLRKGQQTETIEVKIPPGVREGSKVRVRGKGQQGPGGAGDLYIVTHVREHPYFTRQGNDIYVDLPISVSEAVLGGKADVPTIDGMMTLTIPPGAGGGRRLRLKGKGVPFAGGSARGDQYAVTKVVVPPTVSDEGAELLRNFDQTEQFDPRSEVPWK